ncbi:uncharacterized protein LOC143028200 [Oratosquilla oratoria]|uniref:uncharacterized protein LOC143028200 n=1 Tax=Oratosquilla oratoria TaxID=337810 RepID=UPI003F75AEF5
MINSWVLLVRIGDCADEVGIFDESVSLTNKILYTMRSRLLLGPLLLLLLGVPAGSSNIPGYETFVSLLHRIESKVEQMHSSLSTSERLVALEHIVASSGEKIKELTKKEELHKERISQLEGKLSELEVVVEQHNDYRAIAERMNNIEKDLGQSLRQRDEGDDDDVKTKIRQDLEALVEQVRKLDREQVRKEDLELVQGIVHETGKDVSSLTAYVTELQKNCSCLNNLASQGRQTAGMSQRQTDLETLDKEDAEFVEARARDETTMDVANIQATFVTVMDTLQNLTGQILQVQQAVKCPAPYKMVGGTCIWVELKYSMNWTSARHFCEDMAKTNGGVGDLAVPLDISAFKDYMTHIDTDFLWLGASDAEAEGFWKWISGEALSDEIVWAPGEPDDSVKQNYLCVNTKPEASLNDCRNDVDISFVCQYHLT